MKKSVDIHIDALQSEDFETRRDAAEALGRLGGERAVDALIDALDDLSMHYHAARALGKIGSGRAAGPLLAIIGETDILIRPVIATALCRIGEPAVSALINALQDDHVSVRRYAAYALKKIDSPEAREALAQHNGAE